MLYDKRWDKKAELWTLDHIIAWLNTKRGRERYDFGDSTSCAGAQYLQAHGALGPGEWLYLGQIPEPFRTFFIMSRTFGSVRRRAKWHRFKARLRGTLSR